MAAPGKVATKRAYARRSYALKVAAVHRLCRRIEGGENLTQACRDPTMPQRSTMAHWIASFPEFKTLVEAAEAVAAETHPPRRDYHYFDEEVTAEFLARIEDGRGLVEVCAEPDMPAHCTITRWLRERPAFARAYQQAREAQADRLFDLAWRIACEAEEPEWHVAKLKIDAIKWRIGKLVPRKYGPWKASDEGRKDERERDVRFEVRRFAYAPDGVKDITVLLRGLDAAAAARLYEDVEAGRVRVPDDAELAPDEHIAGCFLFKGGEPGAEEPRLDGPRD